MLLAGCSAVAGIAAWPAPVNTSDLVAFRIQDAIRQSGNILRTQHDSTERTTWHGEELLKMPEAAAHSAASFVVASIAATRLFELVRQHRLQQAASYDGGLEQPLASSPRGHPASS